MASYVLEILDGDRAGEVVPLDGPMLRIGRKPGNDLVLSDEKTSGVHAEVVVEGDRYVLRDLGSTNGTTMDGRRVREVVLGHGDSFVIGRVGIRFRDKSQPVAAEGGAEGMAVGKIDLTRLQAAKANTRSRATVALGALLLGAVGAWMWLQSQGGAREGAGNAGGPRAVVAVSGNRLDAASASCESDFGWSLRAGGAGFSAGGPAHTGESGFEAVRTEAADYAVAATSQEIKILAGRPLTAQAHVRTTGGARIAVRLSFWSSNDGVPFRFRWGTALGAFEAWQPIAVEAATPPGCDRCSLELVALLPDASSRAFADDVAITETGSGQPVEQKVGEHGAIIGVGSCLAVRSMDNDEPAVLLWIRPADVAPELRGLADSGQLTFSDIGASLTFESQDNGVRFRGVGVNSLEIGFPADAGSAALADTGSGFESIDLKQSIQARRLLLGERFTRCLLETEQPVSLQARVVDAVLRLGVGTTSWRMQLDFRNERNAAREMLRNAEAAVQSGEPGKALLVVRQALQASPHDSETTALLASRRGELLQQAQDRLQQLATELEEAEFFDTRGGFQRVASEIESLLLKYGQDHMPDASGAQEMLARSRQRLTQLDGQRAQEMRARLQAMAKAFEEADQPGLAKIVREYVAHNFSKQE